MDEFNGPFNIYNIKKKKNGNFVLKILLKRFFGFTFPFFFLYHRLLVEVFGFHH